jgi:general secretion pathway protein D
MGVPAAAMGEGAVPTGGAPPQKDGSDVTIHLTPPLTNIRLMDVLDAITKVSDQPIHWTVEDYAVVFAYKPVDEIQGGSLLYTKVFKINPNTFVQGLESLVVYPLNLGSQTAGGGASGGGGGGGGGQGGGGGNGQGTGASGQIPSVNLAPIMQSSTQGGGGGGMVGQTGPGGQRAGLSYVTHTNNTVEAHQLARIYFTAVGVNFAVPGKTIFFNDRVGELLVRATLQDLEIIQRAIEMLNQTPPQVMIEAKFADLTQEDARGLGFNWYLGNTLINNGTIGAQAGTAPSYQGPSTTANPSGIFPGGGTATTPGTAGAITTPSGTYLPGPGTIASAATDNLLTSGIRNTYGSQQSTLPTLSTITGIMTDPQFRVAIQAIEQRTGSDLLAAPKVTTESGRQAHLEAQDLVTIVTYASLNQTGATGGNLTSSSTAIASQTSYGTQMMALGPSLDVIPTVCADGYSIEMALIPSYTEFIGYDNPGQFIPTAQSVAGSTIGVPITAQLPLPHFRVRMVATACDVWDGQTVVLGGLISETIYKIHDRVPVLGDLPFVGKLFQSQSSDSTKENLLIFVTPTIIDPSGNRVHTDADLPFAKTGIPLQPAPAAAANP